MTLSSSLRATDSLRGFIGDVKGTAAGHLTRIATLSLFWTNSATACHRRRAIPRHRTIGHASRRSASVTMLPHSIEWRRSDSGQSAWHLWSAIPWAPNKPINGRRATQRLVERIAPFCGTAKTTPHNAVFLQGLRAALTADAAWMGGDYGEQPVLGMRAFSRVYAGWGLSQPFYKRELWRQMGFDSLADFLTGFWEKRYGRRDANNLLSMIRTWELNDLGSTPGLGGDLGHGLGAIKAKATIMAGQTDLYFTVEDMKAEAAYAPQAQFRVIPSLWGHMAGSGLNPADSKFIEREVKALLAI